jgi:hypothetical protein
MLRNFESNCLNGFEQFWEPVFVHQDPSDAPTYRLYDINEFVGVSKKTNWESSGAFSKFYNA